MKMILLIALFSISIAANLRVVEEDINLMDISNAASELVEMDCEITCAISSIPNCLDECSQFLTSLESALGLGADYVPNVLEALTDDAKDFNCEDLCSHLDITGCVDLCSEFITRESAYET